MKITITGGSGRFGTVVLRLLAAHGHELLVLDRQAPQSALPAGATFEQSDLMDAVWLRRRLAGQDALVHLAAIPAPATASCSTRIGLIAFRSCSSGAKMARSRSASDQSWRWIAASNACESDGARQPQPIAIAMKTG